MKYIFIQIPCYRDRQIVQTIEDCIKKASNPRRLRFGICWQKSSEEDYLLSYQSRDNFKILTFPYENSKGVCWARNQIQKLYDGEDYIFQLDSHHRFVQDWDKILLKMLTQTDSKKPILTTYGTPFFTDRSVNACGMYDMTPTRIFFHRFNPAGILIQKPEYMRNYRNVKRPEPARFLSGHFIFTSGSFIRACPYDPKLYFHGEEIAMAVRAFTHGYDLYHPNKLIQWHLYAKGYVNKHAYDHDPYTTNNTPFWSDLEVESVRRLRSLLGIPPEVDEPENTKRIVKIQKKYGLGTKRTLEDYQKYAGVDFNLKSVQKYTQDGNTPPNPKVIGGSYDWKESFRDGHRVVVEVTKDEIDTSADDCTFWYVGAHDVNQIEVYRRDLQRDDINNLLANHVIRLSLKVTSFNTPKTCTIWPYSPSKGWLTKTTKQIRL
tara:strand:- start:815 stop:2113 length:1299 start_codon:yes stop_codon:yes gene_type:complete